MGTFSKNSLCPSCQHCQNDFSVGATWCERECDNRWDLPESYYEDNIVTKCAYYKEDAE